MLYIIVGGVSALFGWFMRGAYQTVLDLDRHDFWEQEHYE